MDGVSWSTTRSQESFIRSTTPTADTLSRLASFISQAEAKHHTRNQRQLANHLPTYACKECSKGFTSAADLLHHQELKHTLPKPHRCPSCGQEFSLKSSLQLHKCDHESRRCELCHGASRLGSPCSTCTNRASDPGRSQDKSVHRQPHLLDSSPYACAPCGRGFSHKQALLHHQQAGCSELPSDVADASSLPDDSPPASEGDSTRSDSPDTPGPSGRAVNMCHPCSRTFRTEAGLQHHKLINHAEEEQNTKADGTGGEARKERNAKIDRDPNKGPKSQKKLLTCRSCDMVFRSTSKLYMHRTEKHSREKQIRRESRPVISRRRRGGTYPCQICSKVFFHHLSLRAHYRQHTAWSFTAMKNKQSVKCPTKDSRLSENTPNKVAGNKTVKAGPGRPRKASKADESQMSREVPEVKEEEEEVEEEKEVEEEEEEEEEEEDEEEEEEEREFPCPSCAEVFSLQWQLKEHVELHQSSVKRRHCSVCKSDMNTCKWPSSKRQRLYHCVPCQQGFSALDSFLEHCQEHLRARVEEDRILEASKA
ncbi:zinc finger protein 616 [Amphiprion ocellaris]|uniref:C2H2-type domain-containing protein n=1 Tax=Amphiprion ocellaris TaxID=80972 RepID=A0AAQ5YPR5_AMPOC|nr:zinc finger protein 616 [Amphiprion ocellaris]XP_023146257.2 zinc finger protein 616 [Amphiprion ocellaris]